MGTSRNDRSPMTPPWRMALAVLGTPDTTPSRQNTEIWRAVAADRGPKLIADFSGEPLAEACRIASQRLSVEQALTRFNDFTLRERAAGLAIDICRRALTRCVAERGDAGTFVGELFAEAVSYYASRDLPSYVGASGRIATASDAIQLKEMLRDVTKRKVKGLGAPKTSPRGWRNHISKVLRVLQSVDK